MSDRAVATMLKDRAKTANIEEAEQISGHSMRRGWATSAASAGVPQRTIKAHGRWKTDSIAAGYVDGASNETLQATIAIFTD